MNAVVVAGFIIISSIVLYVVLTVANIVVFILGANSKKKNTTTSCLKQRKINFVIVTKGSIFVYRSLVDVIKNVRKIFPHESLWVVTDEGASLIPTLKEMSKHESFELVIVPRNYNKGKFKARALNYFVERYVKSDEWYVFLDDDSYPLDRNFLCEIDDKIPVYNGILVPRKGGNLFTWLADGVRYYSDITKHRFALEKLRKAVYGLHGELLIVKGWVLKLIGFNTDSISEDSWFAAKLVERGVPVGQVSTKVSILSPMTFLDFARQRGRWFAGRFRDFLRGEYPLIMSLAYLQELLLALALPLSPVLLALKIVYGVRVGGLIAKIAMSAGALGFIIAIISYDIYHVIERRDLKFTLIIPFLMPLFALLETLGVLYGILNFNRLTRTFIIINKNVSHKHIIYTKKYPVYTTLGYVSMRKYGTFIESRLPEIAYYVNKVKVS